MSRPSDSPPPRFRAPVLLALGCLDPAGHTGLVVDVKTCAALGVHAALVPVATSTATTAQQGQTALVGAAMTIAQIGAVYGDLQVDAVKVGNLTAPDGVAAVSEGLQQAVADGHKVEKIVVDPSLVDKMGVQRFDDGVAAALVRHLLRRTTVLCANMWEASLLTRRPVGDRASIRDAAKALFDKGVAFTAIHSPAEERFAVTIVFDGQGFVEFGDDRIRTAHLRGTGDAFSAAVAAELARGRAPLEAIEAARTLVRMAIAHPLLVGGGPHPINPLAELFEARGIDPNPILVDEDQGDQRPSGRA